MRGGEQAGILRVQCVEEGSVLNDNNNTDAAVEGESLCVCVKVWPIHSVHIYSVTAAAEV